MDKKSIIGLVLIGLIMFGYTWYTGKQAAKYQAERAVQDSIALAEANVELAKAADQIFEQADSLAQQTKKEALKAGLGESLFAATDEGEWI